MRRLIPAFLLLVGLAACTAGDGSGLDVNGRPLSEGGALPLEPNFASLQANVFDRSCAVSGCHSGSAAPLGLRLDRGFSYANLVGQASAERPDLLRIAPGAPDLSFLVQKIEGVASVGGRMPLNQPPLAAEELAAVRAWVAAGAPPTADATAIRVASTLPAAGSFSANLPASFVVNFSRRLDETTLSATNVLIDRSGLDGRFADGNEVPIAFVAQQLEPSAGTQLTIGLAGVPDITDVYRLRLIGTGATPIRHIAGEALDGDGDGNAGGDFSAIFTVGDRFAGLQPTLASIQALVFTPICTACHYGALPAGDLNLEDGRSATSLIGVRRPFDPEIRVIAGDAANSFLIMKLDGNLPLLSQGERMPLAGPYLPPTAIAVIRAWIDGGAPP